MDEDEEQAEFVREHGVSAAQHTGIAYFGVDITPDHQSGPFREAAESLIKSFEGTDGELKPFRMHTTIEPTEGKKGWLASD